MPNGNVDEPGKIPVSICSVLSSPRAQGSVRFGDVRARIPYS